MRFIGLLESRFWRRCVCACALPCIAASSGCADLYDMRIASGGAEYWFPRLTGSVELDSGAVAGTTVDIEDDLDLEDETPVNVFARVAFMDVVIEGSFFQAEYEGESTVTRQFTFGGQTFTVGTDVISEADLLFASGKIKVGLAGIGPLAVGAVIGANYLDFEGRVDAPSLAASAEEELQAPFPIVGAVATVHQEITEGIGFFAEAEVTGMAINAYDIDGQFIDAVGKAGFRVFDYLRIGGGWRFIDIDFEDEAEDFTWDLTLSGPFAFAEFVF